VAEHISFRPELYRAEPRARMRLTRSELLALYAVLSERIDRGKAGPVDVPLRDRIFRVLDGMPADDGD
jgi:hypothetical protein